MMSTGSRQPGDVVGDYRLVRAESEGKLTQTWEAEQVSMQRPVMLEMLRVQATHDAGIVAAFLADVKAKALISHPEIGAVYEVVTNAEATFYARERLEGKSLETLHEEGVKMKPVEVVRSLSQIAGAMIHLEKQGIATVDYDLHNFVLRGNRQMRLMNLAVEGQRDDRVDTRAKNLLGEVFDDMLEKGVPGATRVGSLCGFMADQDRPIPLTWEQIEDLSQQVLEQLEGPASNFTPPPPVEPYVPPKKAGIPAAFWALLGGVALICGLIFLLVASQKKQRPVPSEIVEAPKPFLKIPAGNYDAGTLLAPIELSRTEVTIAQYNVFLEFPDHAKFEHPEQPASKKDHLPDDWKALWAASVKGESWNGRTMSTSCPVVGIDWWDAYAYSKWAVGRLPTLKEWVIAASYEGEPTEGAPWGPADSSTSDVTGVGLVGMAGNVREWTGQLEINPAAPLAPKKIVIVGGSFSSPGKGIFSRSWLDSRSLRQPDLGFRIVGRNQ